jgi:hypothetical protein
MVPNFFKLRKITSGSSVYESVFLTEFITSSPLYPQSNGQAERAVQTVKRLLKKSSDSYKSLMCYHNTQIEGLDQSPAQLFLGRRLITSLPTAADLLKPPTASAKPKLVDRQLNAKHYYAQKASRPLPEIHNNAFKRNS